MDYLNYLDLFDQWDLQVRTQVTRKRKLYQSRSDPFLLNENDFKYKYRFSKDYVRKIVDLIKNDIKQDSRGAGISPELQVLTALRIWGRQEVQDDAADLHGVSQQSLTNICRRVALALARRAGQFISMPNGIMEQEKVIAEFREICGFRNTIGAIDCTHIKIKKVGGLTGQYYVNRKGFYSLNVQVICDATLKIRDIVARWRGSTHDSRIFRESVVRDRFENSEFVGHLIGDAGYGLTPYLFTPVNNPTTSQEEAYNKAHILTRNTIERCFGVWKQRFRCLLSGFTVSLENVKLYIIALAVLHNIAVDMREDYDITLHHRVINPRGPPQPVPTQREQNLRGQVARRLFIERYF